jgi:UPF0716 protein FxsA
MLPLLALVLVWPVVELVAAIAIARQIGGGATLLALVLVSVVGGAVFKRTGLSVWRRANEELAAGRSPTRQLLDGALVLVGGVGLLVPGFVSGALGALVLLPPVRALLRPILLAWMGRRAARAARSGRFSGIVIDTAVGADGRVHRRTRRVGEVIDSEGWEVGDEPHELRPGPAAPDDRP